MKENEIEIACSMLEGDLKPKKRLVGKPEVGIYRMTILKRIISWDWIYLTQEKDEGNFWTR
jgi:hypothetical protein